MLTSIEWVLPGESARNRKAYAALETFLIVAGGKKNFDGIVFSPAAGLKGIGQKQQAICPEFRLCMNIPMVRMDMTQK